MAMLFLLVRRT